MSFNFGLGCLGFVLGRSGLYGSNYVHLVDSSGHKHTDIVVTDYLIATHVKYTHAVAPFEPGSETKISTFYFRPVELVHVGSK
jgi:hypothetical protein